MCLFITWLVMTIFPNFSCKKLYEIEAELFLAALVTSTDVSIVTSLGFGLLFS